MLCLVIIVVFLGDAVKRSYRSVMKRLNEYLTFQSPQTSQPEPVAGWRAQLKKIIKLDLNKNYEIGVRDVVVRCGFANVPDTKIGLVLAYQHDPVLMTFNEFAIQCTQDVITNFDAPPDDVVFMNDWIFVKIPTKETISARIVKTAKELCDSINYHFARLPHLEEVEKEGKKEKQKPKIVLHLNQKVTINAGVSKSDAVMIPIFEEEVSQILGLSSDVKEICKQFGDNYQSDPYRISGLCRVDMWPTQRLINLEADIVEASATGSSMQMIYLQPWSEECQRYHYGKPAYRRVRFREFDSICFNLKFINGKEVDLNDISIAFVLHIRECK